MLRCEDVTGFSQVPIYYVRKTYYDGLSHAPPPLLLFSSFRCPLLSLFMLLEETHAFLLSSYLLFSLLLSNHSRVCPPSLPFSPSFFSLCER